MPTGMAPRGSAGGPLSAFSATDLGGSVSRGGKGLPLRRLQAVNDGLVLGYSFNEGSGSVVTDSSSSGIVGTVAGAVWAPAGRHGGALSFNGVSAFVDLGNPAALRITGSMSWAAWVYATGRPPDDGNILARTGGSAGTVGMQFKSSPDTGPHTFGIGISSNGTQLTQRYSTTSPQLNTWYHVAAVYDATARTLDVYVNGVLDNGVLSGTVPASQFVSTANVLIGKRSDGYLFQGLIDDLRVYNRALAGSEIGAVMNTPVGSTSTDTTPPSVPGPVSALVVGSSEIDLSWGAASDDVGVVGYRVERCVGAACSGFVEVGAPVGTSFASTGLSASTTYRFRVRAVDAAGNPGPYTTPVEATTGVAPGFAVDSVVENLDLVDSMRFLPDGSMLMGELGGTIRVVRAGQTQPDATPFNVIAGAVQEGDAGLLDLTLDPGFATNGFYYVYYAHTVGASFRDRVSRFTAAAGWTTTVPGSEVVLWQDDAASVQVEHHGATLAFGPDGKLYISIGDNGMPADSQSLANFHGKVLRINADGTVPADNPFVDGAGGNKDEIWAYGLRNPYRLSFDPPTGRLYAGDVGGNDDSTAWEELNVIVRGANYGWPLCEGVCGTAGVTSPIYTYPHNGRDAAIMGGFVYRGSQFPTAYQGNYFFADYAQNWLKRITLDAAGQVTGVYNFLPLDGSLDDPAIGDPVQLLSGADGSLYYLDLSFDEQAHALNPGTLRRVRFTGTGNHAPTVAIAATPSQGLPPLQVQFSSAGTSDLDGDTLSYAWTFGDAGTSTLPNPSHTYATGGSYTATLVVSDGTDTAFKSTTITVGTAPVGTILTPTDGTTFRAGDHIVITGDGADPDDGVLPDSAFTWKAVFHHDSHIHPAVGPVTGSRSFALDIPTSGHDFQGFTRYEIILTVKDSSGLEHSTSIFIFPQKVNLAFATIPSGLTLQLDSITKTAPFVLDTLRGFHHTIAAPDQTSGQHSYTFSTWSDGGTRSHEITVPDVDTSYAATFAESSPPIDPGLVAAYSFDAGAGTTLTDQSGNGVTGTLTNATWTAAGKNGAALSLNGTNGFVDLGNPSVLRITGSMSWAAWVYATGRPPDDGNILARTGGSAGTVGMQFKSSPDTGPHTFGIGISGDGTQLTQRYSTTSPQLNTWYHVAAVYDATARTLDVYVNGVLDNGVLSGTVPASQFVSTANVLIGKRSDGYLFQGLIDDLRVYNRALAGSEIGAVMNTPVGSTSTDTTPPSVPGPVSLTVVSSSRIDLGWAAATDNVAVTGYRVERCSGSGCTSFTEVGTPATTSFSNTGLAASTLYRYRVRAADAAGNTGPFTAIVEATTPAPPATGDTGWTSPTAQAFDAGGDGNGYQTSPGSAFADDGIFAVDTNSGTGSNTSCTSSQKDKHRFSGYVITLPTGATVKGIEVQLQAKADSTAGSPRICVQLSWNGGASWTSAKTTSTLTTAEAAYILGSASDTWGRAWSATELGTTFRVRVIDVASATARDFSLDWIAVRVSY